MPHRRFYDPKPTQIEPLPATMEQLRALVDEHFELLGPNMPLLESLDWRSRGRALEELDKRLGAPKS